MNYTEKLAKMKMFQIFASLLLIFSMLTSAIPPKVTFANESDNPNIKPGHGEIANGEEKDEDEAKFNKQVSFGDKPGEYFIDLTVEGKDRATLESMDIALIYDNSNSMKNNNRVSIAKTATDNFVNGLLTAENSQLSKGYKMSLITYGSAVFDGRNRDWSSNPGSTADLSHKPLTKNAQDITSKIPNNVPDQRTDGGNRNISTWHGGTFTQQGIEEAGKILDGSSANHKVAVIITDGVTTFSYNNQRTGVEGNGSTYTANHGNRTLAEAQKLKDKGYTVYAVGIEMGAETGISKDEAEQLVKDMATSENHAFLASQVSEVQRHLESIAEELGDTVHNGSILDPITNEFILQEDDYTVTASDESLLEGVTVTVKNQQVVANGLNLGEGEWVNIRYKVQIDTNNHDIDPSNLHKTNGTTTLTPNGDDPDKKYEFPEPEASTVPVEVHGKKIWIDFGYEEYRPDSIDVELIREINGEEKVIKTITVESNGTDVWEYKFDDVFLYDTNGEKIEYKLREVMPDGSQYEPEYGSTTGETVDIRNILKQDAKIQLVKTGKSTSEHGEDVIEPGKDIEYTFEITNTGNLPLKDITLTDELEGMSDVTFETVNGEAVTGDIQDLVLQPGDVLIATATYEVTQEDLNEGQVDNHAEVEGTPTTPDPDKDSDKGVEFDKTPVKDDDDAQVPGELEASISLEKTADKETVSQAGDKVVYTFVVTNTGNTTLTDVTLTDDMLGGDITLEKTTLNPGESTTATAEYEVKQKDINAEKIVNEAEVEGTPPPAYTNNPDNPDKVTDEDNETVKAEQKSEIELVKEANKEELKVDETITYTFTATNTGNTTLTNVQITDVLEGISEISYATINGEAVENPENITLLPGDVLVANATYEVTQDDVDLGQVFNEATVTGIDPKDEEVTDKDDEAVPSKPKLGIELVKTSDKQYVTEAGQEIEYTFEVTNTSNVTLTNVKVNDEMLADLDIDIELEKTTLKPGEKTTAKATYKVTKEDIKAENIKNIAKATGTPPNPNDDPPVSPPAENEVPVAKIQLEKSVLPKMYTEVGQELMYTLEITNTGKITLNEVTLKDDMLGGNITLDVDSLAPGASTEVQVPYTVTESDVAEGEIINTAKTEGTPEGYDPEDPNTPGKVTDEDEATASYAGLIIEKTSDKEEVTEAGEEITYTFEITNVGKVTLEDVVVNDPMLEELDIEVELDNTTLKSGEATTGTAVYTVTQEDIDNGGVYNVATTTGTPPGFDPEDPEFPDKPPVSPPDEEDVPSKQDAKISLKKVADLDEYTKIGEEIKYTFTVTNTGNVTLTDVKVDDETFQIEIGLDKTTLAPGESTTGTFTRAVTQEDFDNGQIHNFANTEGTPPPVIDPEDPDNPIAQDPVTDEDEEKVPGKQKADLSLTKKADKEKIVQAGEEIEYTLTVTNTGNVTLTDVTVNDEMLGGDLKVTPSTLAPGEAGEVKGTYVVTQDDIDRVDEIENIATATGTPPGGDPEDPDNPKTPPTEEKVPVENDPDITLVKQADKEKLVAGETINYTFTATNTGNTTLEKVNLVDELEGISDIDYLTVNGDAIKDLNNITLEPGDVLVASATYKVTQENVDANEVYNHATVEGTPPPKENPEDPDNPIEQDPVTDDDDVKVPSEHKPKIALEKSTEKQEVTEAGEVITYKFVVTNTGNVTLEKVKVNDPMLEELDIEVELEKDALVPGESTVGYADYIVTQEDIDNEDKIENIATATGTTPGENPDDPESPPSEEEVPVKKNPEINLLKVADEKTYAGVGEEVTYIFAVTNTGNVTLTDVKVYDETFDIDIENLEETTLSPGQSTKGTYTHKITQADLDNGEIHNFANAEGTPPPVMDPEDPDNPVEQDPVKDEDDEKITGKQKPLLELEKVADKQEVSQAGEKIEYTLTVTNTGNVTLTDVTVNDEMLGGDLKVTPSTLAPGESGIVTGKYEVTQEDIDNADKIINIATATGTPPDPADPEDPTDPPETPPVEEEVPVVQKPSLALEKVADKDIYEKVGEKIKYTFTVTNTGNVTLSNVKVYDKTFDKEIELEETTLKPGESTTGTYMHKVSQKDLNNGEIHNFANAEGTPPAVIDPEDPDNPVEQEPVTDEDDEKVPAKQHADLAIKKKADKQEVSEAGEEIEYTLTVTNTGNVTLTNVMVNDEMLGGDLEVTPSTLKPGEKGIVTGNYEVTQDDIDNADKIVNIATATGTPPGGDPEDPDNPKTPPVEEDVPVIKDPAIAIEKTAKEKEVVNAGDTITYSFVVTNTGNVTLDNVEVNDPMLEKAGVEVVLEKTTLKPGESTNGVAVYTVTQVDIDRGIVKNVATSTGTPPGYDPENPPTDPKDPTYPPVSPPDEVEVPVKQDSAISLVKEADKKEVSQAGEVVTYTFTVMNTGNMTLKDVSVYDETFKMDVDVAKTTLKPGQSTKGTLQYVVTQDDIDNNGIHNVAIAEGTPPNYDPEDPDSEKPTDKDDEKVFNKKEPNISLQKNSDTEKVTEVGQKVTYTFVVTNTGNTSLDDLKVIDPMLEEAGIKVELDKTTLKPGESATGKAVYTVTKEDLKKSDLVNIATVTGTPPGYNPNDPESPQPPTDEDEEIVPVEDPAKPGTSTPQPPVDPEAPEKPGDKLPNTATQVFNLLAIGLGILLAGLSIFFIARRGKQA